MAVSGGDWVTRIRVKAGDRGAAAVEFALLLPVVLLLVFGLIDFGRALNAQITLTQAAREGARLASFGQASAAVVTRTQTAANGLSLPAADIAVTTCAPGAGAAANAQVTISYPFSFATPIGAIMSMFGSGAAKSLTLTATATMPCET